MTMSMYGLLSLLIPPAMLMMPIFLSMKQKTWFEGLSSFECGMNLMSFSRKPFSIRFFLLMVLFIIFDIEIVLILAMPMITPLSSQMMLFIFSFISILTVGTMYEWLEGSLNWKL